jgi:hypothetical protein
VKNVIIVFRVEKLMKVKGVKIELKIHLSSSGLVAAYG